MKVKKYRQQIEALRAHRSTDVDSQNELVELKKRLLPVHQEINRIIRNAQKRAELELLSDVKFRHIVRNIQAQDHVDSQMRKGNVEGAAYIQQENLKQRKNLEKQELLQYGGSR